jgi:hypothetical protein
MEPAVRGARVESAIKQGPGLERSVVPSKNSQDSRAAWGIGPSQPRARGTEFLDAETDGQKPLFRRLETDMKTRVNSKSPRSAGQMHGYPAEFDTCRLGGGDDLDRTGCSPPSLRTGLCP